MLTMTLEAETLLTILQVRKLSSERSRDLPKVECQEKGSLKPGHAWGSKGFSHIQRKSPERLERNLDPWKLGWGPYSGACWGGQGKWLKAGAGPTDLQGPTQL